MRQGQQNNRRGRGRGRKVQNPLARNFESNGPDVKIRGTAAHIAEKYTTLARDAAASGDSVQAENYLQHAEHYNRIIMAAQAQFQAANPTPGDGSNGTGNQRHRRQGQDEGGRTGESLSFGDDLDDQYDNERSEEPVASAPRMQRQEPQHRRSNGSAEESEEQNSPSEDAPDSVVA